MDSGFGAGGRVTTDFGGDDQGQALALQPDGKLVVVGSSDHNFALVRYLVDGRLDPDFGEGGQVTTDFGGRGDGRALALQPDGKLVVAGSSNGNFTLARYRANGSLDSDFGAGGIITTALGGLRSYGRALAIQPDSKLVVAGSVYLGIDGYSFALARYLADGRLDPDFGEGGRVTTRFGGGGVGQALALQPDGKLVVAGSSVYNFALARYLADGRLDPDFGTGGRVKTAFGGNVEGHTLALQADGKLVVAGSVDVGNDGYNFALARYRSDGRLDTSFGSSGHLTTDFGGHDHGSALTLQPDGKLVLAGYSWDGSGNLALARFGANGSLDTGFGPIQDTLAKQPYTSELSSVVLAPRASILDAELAALGAYDGATLTLRRQGGANAEDVFSAKFGGSLTDLTSGSNLALYSVTIGQVISNSGGTLQLRFLGANARQSLVDKAMQQIAYSNTSKRPPAQVLIDWTFDDGNTGDQGAGGALSTTGTVSITPENDYPQLVNAPPAQTAVVGKAFNYTLPANTFSDPDGDTLSYRLTMADDTGVPPWLSFNPATQVFSGTPGQGDIGTLNLRITAKDPANASAEAYLTLTIQPQPTPLTASVTAANKTYNGNTNATITSCALTGVVSGDTVTCSATAATFADANVGVGKTVTATGITLAGVDAGKYTLSNSSATTTADITNATNEAGYTVRIIKPSTGVIHSEPAGILCGGQNKQCLSSFSSANLTATPNPGYEFTQWIGCPSSQGNVCIINPTGALTLKSVFKKLPKYTLKIDKNTLGSVVSNPPGLICPGKKKVCNAKYVKGTEVILTGVPQAGNSFIGWTGVCSGIDPCRLLMDGNKMAGAAFQ